MAERRMFAKTIIDSDAFLDMPLSTQALYFHLSMRADDDGFINNPLKITRVVNASKNDLDLLIAKRFVIGFESGVIVIKHWRLHNYIRKDRYNATFYQEEKALLDQNDDGTYTIGQPNDNQRLPQVRLGKVSIGKDNIYAQSAETDVSESMSNDISNFEQFWKAYPKKVGKGNCQKWFKSHKPKQELVEQMITAINQQKDSKQWQEDNGKFIPNPYTWLNGERWCDELPAGQKKERSYNIDKIEETGHFDLPPEDF